MNALQEIQTGLGRFQKAALVLGVIGLAACAAGFTMSSVQFFRSYLCGFLFWFGIVMGAQAILMLQYLTGGAWGVSLRRSLEAVSSTVPLTAILFIPIALGVRQIFPWTNAEEVAASAVLREKTFYLNVPGFWIRAVIYFVIWIVLNRLVIRVSKKDDGIVDSPAHMRVQLVSGLGLVIYGLTTTFASVDWVMSLTPEWFSTIYGLHFVLGQVLSAMAFAIVLNARFTQRGLFAFTRDHFHDFGNLLLAFVMLWAYLSLSQFLIIWCANLPEEITWYLDRSEGGWQWAAIGLAVLHFLLPFFALLTRLVKMNAVFLSKIAFLILLTHYADLFWYVVPGFHPKKFFVHWMDLAAWVGIGGVWLAYFAATYKKDPMPTITEISKH